MPWNESRVSDERLKFIAEVLRGAESMTDLCLVFGISRKTGYKWRARYHAGGPPAVVDMSRRPHTNPQVTPTDISNQILALRAEHPTWGARKLRARLQRLHPEQHWPAASTIHTIVKRAGLTRTSQRRRIVRFGQPLAEVTRANQVWCMDFQRQL
jgi:transposase-like protein